MSMEQKIRGAFSQVKVSEETKMEVLNMKKQESKKSGMSLRRMAVLAAAVLTLLALSVTAFAAEEIADWAKSFFLAFSGELNQEQADYLAQNEQPILESKTVDGWTVELKSALTDGNIGILTFDLKGPEGSDAKAYSFVNTVSPLESDLVTMPDGVSKFGGWGILWLDDGDGLANTKRMILKLDPDEELSEIDPFGPDAQWNIHFGKLVNANWYARPENLKDWEVATNGPWDFTVSFTKVDTASRELLEEPVTVTGYFDKDVEGEWTFEEAPVVLTSVELRNLTVTVYYEDDEDKMPGFYRFAEDGQTAVNPRVIMKDGTEIELISSGSSGFGYETLVATAPIVIENADHILLADGTVIPVQ